MWYDYKDIFYEDKTFEKTVELINERRETYILHDKCKIIGDSTFHKCNIKKMDIPSSVEEIETEAFVECQNLKNVKFNEGLKKIGACAFEGCFSLGPDLRLPNSLETLEQGAFAYCCSLKYITLGNELKILPTRIFEGCRNVLEISFSNIEQICAKAITDAELKKITLPITLKEIDYFSFDGCKIGNITFEGTKEMFFKIIGGKEFYERYKKIMEFETPTLEKLLDNGFSMKDANNLIKNIEER